MSNMAVKHSTLFSLALLAKGRHAKTAKTDSSLHIFRYTAKYIFIVYTHTHTHLLTHTHTQTKSNTVIQA